MSEPGLGRVFRDEYAAVVAALARRFGDLDLAEEATGDALVTAAERWAVDGLPPNPGGWLTTTATRKALDRLRRESRREQKHEEAVRVHDDSQPAPTGVVDDDRLRLVFTCCHPALRPEARVALTLRLVAGLTVPEIASAFLVQETTMAARITRAKAKIKAARIPYRVPSAADLPERLDAVLRVVYLVFNEGYLSAAGGGTVRDELAGEAVRLARLLRALAPGHPETTGLLALLLLTAARRPARVVDGELVPLDRQDRSRWDRDLVAEGHALVRECLATGRPGPYQLQAAINAVHTDAPRWEATDWSQVVRLYDTWMALAPTPVVALNRAIALAELDGPAPVLPQVERLALTGYHPWHVARADLLRRLDRAAEAVAAYDDALALVDNPGERAFLEARRDALRGRSRG